MSLVADYTDSSSSDNLTDSDTEDVQLTKAEFPPKKNEKEKLPSATQVLSTKAAGKVLSNPYLEAELAEIAVLEKHVKMVNNDDHLLEKNGRKICWNYRKGRCRFGTSCQYAHDSDLNAQKENPIKETTTSTDIQSSRESPKGKANKRNRPGISDTIEPSKRTMKSYMAYSRRT